MAGRVGSPWSRDVQLQPSDREMAKGYSRHITAPRSNSLPPQVWKIVRDFNTYPVWVGGAGESAIEDGKSGDAVGGCQERALPGPAHSAAAAGAIRRQAVANLRILRRGDTGRRDELTGTLRSSFGKWLESLRSTMANLPAGFPEAATEEPGGRSQLVSV